MFKICQNKDLLSDPSSFDYVIYIVVMWYMAGIYNNNNTGKY